MGFIFGGNTGLTYDDVQRKRAIVDRLYEQNSTTPRNVGEGLTAIGRALAGRHIEKQAAKADKANRAESDKRNQAILSSLFGTGTPYNPPAKPVPTPNPQNIPQGIVDAVDQVDPQYGSPRDKFIAEMTPHALRVSEATGVDPRIVIAQAAQETGWGKSAPNNNYFGVKSHGKGGEMQATKEFRNGKMVGENAAFRTYGGMGQSADDYGRFLLENPRYQEMLNAGDLDSQVEALGRSGYATDPNYASSVGSIARSINLDGQQPAPTGQPQMAAIMQALNDPYTDAGTKAMLQMQVQKQMQRQDPMAALELEKARLEVENLRNPKPKAAPNSVREYRFYEEQERNSGREPLSYAEWSVMDEKASIPPQGAPPDEEELRKKLGGKEGELWATYLDSGGVSAGTVQDMDLLDEISTMAPQGPITGRLASAFPGANSAADAFESVVKRVAPTLRAPGSGSTSDIEYAGMLKALPQLSAKPEANRAIIAMMRAKSQINIDRANIVRAYQNGEIQAKDARAQMSDLEKRSIMTPELKYIMSGLSTTKQPIDMDGYTIEEVK